MNAPPAKTIMLIDDSSTNNILYESILLDEGYDVIVCEDAKTALKILPQNVPDLIILDLMMPVMDGVETLRRIRKLGYAVPIIVVTADIEGANRIKCLELGVAAFINKPIYGTQVVRLINEVLKKQ